jgi:predicted DNA-binding transcriptional regulator AlpA
MVNNDQGSTMADLSKYDDSALLRLSQIIGNSKKGIKPLIPVSRSTFLNGVKSGLYPKPIKLGVRSVAWRYSALKESIKNFHA